MENDTPPLSRRERQSVARSEQILDAAARLFAERGFHRTTTRDIAEAADVAEGTLYNYFANKDDLLMGIMRRLTESIGSSTYESGKIPINAREFFLSLMQMRKGFQRENTIMMQALLSEILANTELRERYYHQLLEPMIRSLEKSLELHRQIGQVKCAYIPEAARVLTGMMLGLFFLEVVGDPVVNSNSSSMDDAIISLFFDGISPRMKTV